MSALSEQDAGAKAQAEDVKEQAKEKARGLKQDARGRAVEQVDQAPR
jgi:hypothetical protein